MPIMASNATDSKRFASLAATPLGEPISPEALEAALSKKPFVPLEGSFNLRDVGTFAPGYVKPRTVFRSGMTDNIPESSQPLLRSELGLSKIHDFRRAEEIRVALRQIDGIQQVPCRSPAWASKPMRFEPADFVLKDGEAVSQGYKELYANILQDYTDGFRTVFESLKTAKEGDGVLYHCTAGKDRTGIMTALLLDLMGAPVGLIADEYAITRIGMEPFRERLLPSLVKSVASKSDATDAVENASATPEEVINSTPGLIDILASYEAIMLYFMDTLQSEHGGAEGYLKSKLGFTDQDIKEIRDNLRPEEHKA